MDGFIDFPVVMLSNFRILGGLMLRFNCLRYYLLIRVFFYDGFGVV